VVDLSEVVHKSIGREDILPNLITPLLVLKSFIGRVHSMIPPQMRTLKMRTLKMREAGSNVA
jgi:hypothetical protein